MIAGIIKASHWEIDSFRRLQRSGDEMFLGIKKGFVSKIEVTSQKIEDVAQKIQINQSTEYLCWVGIR